MTARTRPDFVSRFGPWAVVAGASSGLGEAFAEAAASRGIHLVLVARRQDLLHAVAHRLSTTHGVQVRPLVHDVADPDAGEAVGAATGDLDVGLLVYNAAASFIGPFLDTPLAAHLTEVDTNCRGPLTFAHTFGRRMAARGRGGIVLMSSLSASIGSALIANYAATKAYNLVLAEGLWEELRGTGVTVMACLAGATDTPNYRASTPRGRRSAQAPAYVAEETLDRLGSGPNIVPGTANRLSALALLRLMPRTAAIRTMGRVMRGMYGGR